MKADTVLPFLKDLGQSLRWSVLSLNCQPRFTAALQTVPSADSSIYSYMATRHDRLAPSLSAVAAAITLGSLRRSS